MNLAVYIESVVKSFERYHKYTIGVNLRERTQKILFLISQANMAQDKTKKLFQLRDMCEMMKITIALAKELKASFLAHAKHANSYNLIHTVGAIHESNPFDFDRS